MLQQHKNSRFYPVIYWEFFRSTVLTTEVARDRMMGDGQS